MKLKSKLIATIVSMCAAIAVMGVGVWASSSQSFQITVKNDIDVKIISVDADVYGEFAVYSQFSGHSVTTRGDGRRETNPYAQAYHATDTRIDGFLDRNNLDHGYLLYASSLSGYNDGIKNSDAAFTDDATKWYNWNAIAEPTSGYYKYSNEAKEGVYFATAESDGISDSAWKGEKGWAEKNYNVDFNTRTAQITYMYTIRQWKRASANAATNQIDLILESSLSYDSSVEQDIDNDLNLDVEDTADNLTDALYNAAGTAGIYIDAFITNATAKGDTANNPAAGVDNGIGKTTDTLNWHKMDLRKAYTLPASEENETYYIMLTYTFARTGANLDLSGLQNAVEHTLVLTPPEKLADVYQRYDETRHADPVEYDESLTKDHKLCYATGKYDADSPTGDQYAVGSKYQIYGKEFVPKFTPAQVSSSLTQTQLASYFALYDTAGTGFTGFSRTDHTALGSYLTQGGQKPNHSNILQATVGSGVFAENPTTMDRPGYIFATKGTTTNAGDYYPDITAGTTGYFVKRFNEGSLNQIVTHDDSITDKTDTQATRESKIN